jgi:hypothetical protein
MTFRIEITRTWYYVKSDEVETWTTDPHRTEEAEMEYDTDAKLEYDTPVKWAVAMLRNESIVATPWMAGFPDLEPSGYPIPDAIESHWWLSGTQADNYTDEESEWSIRLVSPEWTPEMRAEVFRGAK